MACRGPETETTPSVIRRNRSRFREWASLDQETLRKPKRGENFEGSRLDDRRTIPHLRLGPLVDQDTRHIAAGEFNCKRKTRRTSTMRMGSTASPEIALRATVLRSGTTYPKWQPTNSCKALLKFASLASLITQI